MNNNIASIIIPVYNCEKTIEKCICSVMNQTYKNIEIIVVNDGSTDSSLDLCRKYETIDNRITVITKSNEGVSSARNVGIEHACGDYIIFVDGDDQMSTDAVETLIYEMTGSSQLVCGSYTMIKSFNRKKDYQYVDTEMDEVDIKYNAFDLTELISYAPWAKIFKTSIIKDNNIRFKTDIPYGEDGIFLLEYLRNVNSIKLLSKSLYMYDCSSPNSAMKKYYEKFWFYMKRLSEEQIQTCRVLSDECFKEDIEKEIEKKYYLTGLKHYILNGKGKVYEEIRVLSQNFKLLHEDICYGQMIENSEWEKIIKTWKKNNYRIYLWDRIKGKIIRVIF